MGNAQKKPKLVPHLNLVRYEDRIKWSPDTVDLLANAIIKDCGIKSSYDVMPIHYQAVEKILHKDQRRTIVARAALSRVIKRIAEILGEGDVGSAYSENRIHWTNNEDRLLAKTFVTKGGVSKASDVTIPLYNQIKDVLPPERQRIIKQLHQLKYVLEEIPGQLRAFSIENEERHRAEQAQLEKLAQEEEQKFTIVLKHDENTNRVGAIFGLLMETLAAQSAELFMGHLHKELHGINDSELARFLSKTSAKKAYRPRVVVGPLLAEQCSIIEGEFDGLLDVRCVTDKVPHQSLQDKIKHADTVVCMINFSSHPLYHLFNSHSDIRRVNGGLDSLRKVLMNIAGVTDMKESR